MRFLLSVGLKLRPRDAGWQRGTEQRIGLCSKIYNTEPGAVAPPERVGGVGLIAAINLGLRYRHDLAGEQGTSRAASRAPVDILTPLCHYRAILDETQNQLPFLRA